MSSPTTPGADAENTPTPPRSRFALVVIGQQLTRTYELPLEGDVVVGRGNDCGVSIPDPSVSRRHALLRIGPSVTVEDLESANGTWLRDPSANSRGDSTDRYQTLTLTAGRPLVVEVGQSLHFGSVIGTLIEVEPEDAPASWPVIEDFVMQRLLRLAERVAESQINVLLLGETGVGKEVFAELIHKRSPRARGPLLRLNCAAMTESLLESELFGHEKGAFTGALQAKPGLLEAAGGGTVFLDEIGELPASIQAKLLRVLEAREVTRVGGLRPRPLDVRFVFATNRDLEEEVRIRNFRSDLYFRINGISLLIPPLRERRGEIAPLARSFLREMARRAGRPAPMLQVDVLAALEGHEWPGNVRELRNVIERALVLCEGGRLGVEHLSFERRPAVTSTVPPPPGVAPVPREEATQRISVVELGEQPSRVVVEGAVIPSSPALPRVVAPAPPPPSSRGALSLTREQVQQALEQCAGNQTQAAKLLGVSRRTLVTRIEEFGLPRPRKATSNEDP